jgi:hypothetical protein
MRAGREDVGLRDDPQSSQTLTLDNDAPLK